MVVRLEGMVDSVPVVFNRVNRDRWECIVPKTLNGAYVVELTATDEAGNISYTARYILSIDVSALRVKLQRYSYISKVRIGKYYAKLSKTQYGSKVRVGNYYAALKQQGGMTCKSYLI